MRNFFFLFLVSLFCLPSRATTFYISTTGSDSGNGSSSQPWSTFAHAWTGMHPGDTLTVNCGIYTQQVKPTVSGSAGSYITIQAATDWCVTVDGGSLSVSGTLYLYQMSYIMIRGIKFAGTPSGGTVPVDVSGSNHIKLIKTAAYNAPCSGNNEAFVLGPSNSYLLVEDSYSWGCGRYKFLTYQSDHVILRHDVARHDFHSGTWGAQSGLFTFYDSYQFLCQNCIGLDSGKTDLSNGTIWGAVWSENNDVVSGHGTSGRDNSGKFEGDIFINIITNAPYVGTFDDQKLVGTREVVDTAMINNDSGFVGASLNLQPDSLLLHHMTISNVTGTDTSSFNAGGVGATNLSNTNFTQEIIQDSTIQQAHDFGVADSMNSDYNLLYSNGANFGTTEYQGHTPSAGLHDIQGTNPQLKYPTRVETGTPGKGTASDGGDKGATILYRIGTPGTLWGDTGYDTVTTTPLWPWDDEGVIKTDMASYNANGITGARGFAAAGNGLYGGPITLTSYVWEQLGYACPLTICVGTAPTLTSITVSPATASISAGATQQYTATCNYSDNSSSNCTTSVTWTSSNTTAATISIAGLASSISAGTATIGAVSGSITGSGVLTITGGSLAGITVAPSIASITSGATQQYAATCTYSNSTSTDCTASVTWSSSSSAVATISTAGLASGVAAGNTTIKAAAGSITGSAVLTVTNPSLTTITVTPATASIVAGTGSQQYAARCTYSNGTSSNCTSSVIWSSSNTAVATISSAGLASGVAAGTATINAVSGSVTGSSALTVISSTLTGITVTPTTASITQDATQQYAAMCTYSNSTNSDCTGTVTWSSSNTAAATISGSGLASGVAAGTATIKAASGSITGSGTLTVTAVQVNPTSGLWTWMGGSSTAPGAPNGQAGSYSTLGAPSAGSIPGSREAAISWADGNGNFWLFGGGGYDSAGVDGYLNDLWEFIPSIEEWAWMGGGSTVPAANKGWPGVYGTLDTPATGNFPGGREASASWTDKTGNLWLFGGVGYDYAGVNGSLNDLWEYFPSTQEWAWMGGSRSVPAANLGQPGVYGQQGVPAPANTPGGRWGANSWLDLSGNLWLFGGVGYDSSGSLGSLNDLWELNPFINQWAWMSGSSLVGSSDGPAGTYGSFGNAASTNVPSGRSQAVSWIDASGDLWLFGGKGYDSTGTLGYLNDLWEFNPSTREWAWMGGSNTVGCVGCGKPGVYGVQGEAATANVPGGRNEAVGWTDSTGNFWLLGGVGFDSAGVAGTLNDLWEFLPSSREWAWESGSSTVPAVNQGQPGVYGRLGVPSATNVPGGRWGAGTWTDGYGNLWLFGGAGYDSHGTYDDLNDLWVYQPSADNLPAATPNLSLASGTYNTTESVTITDATPGATIYYTTNGTTPGTNSSVYSGPITVASTMTIEAIASANGYKTSAVTTANYTITAAFAIAPRPGSATNVTVQPGGAAIYSLVVTPIGSATFPAAITLTVSGVPPGSTATFTPATVAAGLGATNVSLSIQTSTTSATMVPGRSIWTVALCLLFLPLLGMRRWRRLGNHLSVKYLLAGMLLFAGETLAISGCGGGAFKKPGSVTGTPTAFTITVIGASGNVSHTTNVTLTLQ